MLNVERAGRHRAPCILSFCSSKWRLMHFDISLACFAQTGYFVVEIHFKQSTCNWYTSSNRTLVNTELGVKEKCDSIIGHAIIQDVDMSLNDLYLRWWWCGLLKICRAHPLILKADHDCMQAHYTQ